MDPGSALKGRPGTTAEFFRSPLESATTGGESNNPLLIAHAVSAVDHPMVA